MATIRKRNGKYQVQVRLKASPSMTRTFATKTEAIRWARATEAGSLEILEKSAAKEACNVTFGELLIRYYNEVLSLREWHRRDRVIIDNYRTSALYNTNISQITEGAVARYRDDRLKKVKPATVVREIALASHCITTAQREWGMAISSNSFKAVRKPKVRNERDRRLSVGEFDGLVRMDAVAAGKSIICIVEFAIETAMRKGELLRVKWADVNFERSTLHIPLSKNGYSRTIPLTPKAIGILRKIDRKKSSFRIFDINYNTLGGRWSNLLKRANISNYRWHDLRHEGISRHFERGLNVPGIALISGHRNYQMLRRYTHIKPESLALKLARLAVPSE